MKWYVTLGWVLTLGGLVAWPASQLTIARTEPPFTLALSWLAVVLSGLGNLMTAYVKRDQDDNGGPE